MGSGLLLLLVRTRRVLFPSEFACPLKSLYYIHTYIQLLPRPASRTDRRMRQTYTHGSRRRSGFLEKERERGENKETNLLYMKKPRQAAEDHPSSSMEEAMSLARRRPTSSSSSCFPFSTVAVAVHLCLLLASCASSPDDVVPAFPVGAQTPSEKKKDQSCRLDLSEELFGGVGEACSRTLDRSRCCPVLAAWFFAAHARSALELEPSSAAFQPDPDVTPMVPDDSQGCVDSLQDSLHARDVVLARPNSSCDAVLCFCGIRLHKLGTLRCPAAFDLSLAHLNATPTAAVRTLERNCRNSSYAGCTRCLQSLHKVGAAGGSGSGRSGGGDDDEDDERASKMLARDCQLLGLTWLLAKNKTAYIPTVSAVLRAIMYSSHPVVGKCSPDQENMPLAVDSLHFHKYAQKSASVPAAPLPFALTSSLALLLPALFFALAGLLPLP